MPRPKSEPNPQTPFGQWVKGLLDRHGLNTREQRIRTGVSNTVINDWLNDRPPSVQNVVKFANGFGENADAALELAGLEPLGLGKSKANSPSKDSDLGDAAAQLLEIAERKLAYERVDDPVLGEGYGGRLQDLPPKARLAIKAILDQAREDERGF